MATVTQPTLIPRPWASNGSKETIPDTTTQFGRASWSEGFPSETAQPLTAGGIPPNWLDFQGVLYALSQHATFEQVGGRYAWSNTQNYPVGACILGSNGMVYQALQESGPGTSAGAKNPTNASNTAYWGPMATPDGTTIIVQNGKLTAVAQGDADSLADGQTIIASNGKLVVNLASAPTAKLQNINNYLIDNGGGLAVDANGHLFVDFSTMPTDKFEELLASLRMQAPLSGNKNLYVDNVLGSDTITEGGVTRPVDITDVHGGSSKPFATISACVKYATAKYAVGQYTLTINVRTNYNGTTKIPYEENIVLPTYNRTSGSMRLAGVTTKQVGSETVVDPPIIKSPTNSSDTLIQCTGGTWLLRNLIVQCIVSEPAGTAANHYVAAIRATGSSAALTVYGCDILVQLTGTPVRRFVLYVFDINTGGSLTLGTLENYHNSLTCNKGDSGDSYFFHLEDGRVTLPSANPNSFGADDCVIACSGSASTFAWITENSMFSTKSSVGYYTQSFSGSSVTAKKYDVTTGSGCVAPSAGFPGNTAGSVDSSTYSWYSAVS